MGTVVDRSWGKNVSKAEGYDYGDPPASDYWTAQAEAMNLVGKGLDMSPHGSALRTFYMEDKIDKGLDDDDYGTTAMTEIMENAEARFLDTVYDSDGKVREGIDSSYGFDLRRTGLDDNMDVRSPEYWDKLMTNPVNWESYENDLSFIAMAKELSERHPDIYKDWDTDPGEGFSFNKDRFGEDNKDLSIQLIRHANQGAIGDIVKDSRDLSKRHWEGRYDPDKIYEGTDGSLYIDGERQISPSEQYGREKGDINPDTGKAWTAQERGRLLDSADYAWKGKNIVGPKTPVIKPNLNIKSVSVKRPANIPASWGSV